MATRKFPGAGRGWRRLLRFCPHGHAITGIRRSKTKGVTRYCVICNRARLRNGKGLRWRREALSCKRGHPFEGDNLGVQVIRERGTERETRLCKACHREAKRRYKARLRKTVLANQEALSNPGGSPFPEPLKG